MRNRESANTTDDEQPVIYSSMETQSTITAEQNEAFPNYDTGIDVLSAIDSWTDVSYSPEFGIYFPIPNFVLPDVEQDAESGEPVFEDGLRTNLGNADDYINPLALHEQNGQQSDEMPDVPCKLVRPEMKRQP